MPSYYRNRITEALNHWYIPLIVGIVFIIVGIVAFTSPVTSFLALSMIFSLSFLFGGIAEVVFAVTNRNQLANWGWTLAFGVVTVIVGLLLLVDPALSVTTLALYIGFVVLFRSISAISYSMDLRHYGSGNWGGLLALGVIGTIVAFILIWNPLFAGLSAVILVAMSFIFTGLFSIFLSLQLRRLHQYADLHAEK